MKKRLTYFLTALTLISPIAAETITLKDGTQFEGTITAETDTIAMVTVNVNDKIKEERVINKSDILTIIKNTSEIADYKKLANLLPTPDNWTEADYSKVITKQIDPFLKEFKTSPFIGKVKGIKETLTAEQKKLSEGSVKVKDVWYTKDEQAKDQIEFDSISDLREGVKLAKTGRFAQALNILDKFTTVYAHTSNSLEAIDAREQTINAFEKQIKKKLANHKELVSANRAKLKAMDREEARQVRSEMKAAAGRYKDFVSAQKKQKDSRWLSINDLHKSEMTRNLKLIESEKSKGIKTVANAAEAYRKAFMALEAKDLEAASDQLKILKNIDHTDKYYDPFEAQLKTLKDEQSAMAKAKKESMKQAKAAAREKAKAEKEANKKKVEAPAN